jgi:flavin reductase (DIM6/NTAB) family NADH-FMN oxidoreductase RutF
MHLDPEALSVADRYKLLIGAVVPRPIALVSTLGPGDDGAPNLAPFSFFTAVGSNPMMLMFCPANTPEGHEKDTLRNAKLVDEGGQGEFVVNVVRHAIGAPMSTCAAELPYGQSEWALSGLTMEPSRVVRPSRVAQSPAAFECRTERVIRTNLGQPGGGNIVIGRVVAVWCEDGAINERFHIDPAALDAIGRMGGSSYCTTRERFELARGVAPGATDAGRPNGG